MWWVQQLRWAPPGIAAALSAEVGAHNGRCGCGNRRSTRCSRSRRCVHDGAAAGVTAVKFTALRHQRHSTRCTVSCPRLCASHSAPSLAGFVSDTVPPLFSASGECCSVPTVMSLFMWTISFLELSGFRVLYLSYLVFLLLPYCWTSSYVFKVVCFSELF